MMPVLLNILMNVGLTLVFVLLSNRALQAGLEETLVAYALLFGLIVVVANAVYVARVRRRL